MLQPHIPWLSDGYRARLQQEEKQQLDSVPADGRDSLALCPEDHIESFAELSVQRSPGGGWGEAGRAPEKRVRSAQPRLGWGAGHDGAEGFLAAGGEGEEGGSGWEGGDDNSLWAAAKRRSGGGLTYNSSISRGPRPSSSRTRAFRAALRARPSSSSAASALPPRPSSALDRTRPSSALDRTRPSSAVFAQKEQLLTTTESGGLGRAPAFGAGAKKPRPRSSPRPRLRPHSASAAASLRAAASGPVPTRADPYTARQRRLEALYQAWVEDPRSGLHIGAGPGGAVGPSPALLDRHARCLQQQQQALPASYHQELPERPHTSCGVVRRGGGGRGEVEGGGYGYYDDDDDDGVGGSLFAQQQRDNMSRVQRYIDCHRPSSAPGVVRDEGHEMR